MPLGVGSNDGLGRVGRWQPGPQYGMGLERGLRLQRRQRQPCWGSADVKVRQGGSFWRVGGSTTVGLKGAAK